MHKVTIGLGTNLGDKNSNLLNAIERVWDIPDTIFKAQSRIYQSKALQTLDPESLFYPDFYNMVILLETSQSPEDLLQLLKNIEYNMGRDFNATKWSPRIIDLDILTFGMINIESTDLTIPHSEMLKRDFVMIPLAEIYPEGIFSGKGEFFQMTFEEMTKILYSEMSS